MIADSLVQENISCHQNWVRIQPQTTFFFVNTSFSLKEQIYSEKKEIELESCRTDWRANTYHPKIIIQTGLF